MQLLTLPVRGPDDDPDEPAFYGDIHAIWPAADGRRLAVLTGYQDGGDRVRWWDLAAGRQVAEVDVVSDDEHGLCHGRPALTPDHQLMAWDDRLVWTAEPGRRVGLGGMDLRGRDHRDFALTPDGSAVYGSGDGVINRWEVVPGVAVLPTRRVAAGDAFGLAVTPCGSVLVAVSVDGQRLLRWRLPGHEPLPPVEWYLGRWGGRVAVAAGGMVAVHSGPFVHLIDPLSGVRRRSLTTGPASDFALTPDGGRLLTVGADGMVSMWDAATGAVERYDFSEQAGAVQAVAVAPDGLTAFAGGDDGRVVRWDL